MQSPKSRVPNADGKPTCGKGCAEICSACAGFELEENWDAGITEPLSTAKPSPAKVTSPEPAPATDPSETASIAPPASRAEDKSWLESRIADIAAKLEQTVKTYDPAPALDKFSTRLDNFEARVEAVVDRAAAGQDPESLRFIEARVREIDDQFDKMRGQIGRISTIDARVAEIWDHVQLDLPSPTAGLPKLVEGAVSRALAAASVLKAEGAAAEAPEVAAFERIEDALDRLIERVEAIEVQATAPERASDDPADDIDLINRAYEEGARALGLIMTDAPSDPVHTLRALHAAHYVPRVEEVRAETAVHATRDAAPVAPSRTTASGPSVFGAEAPPPTRNADPVDPRPAAPAAVSAPVMSAVDLRDSFRASAWRAKQRAQAEAEMYARALPVPAPAAAPASAPMSERVSQSPARVTPSEVASASPPISSLFPPAQDDADATAMPSILRTDAKKERDKAEARAKEAATAALAQAKRPLSQGRWNRGFFLALSMLLLSGGSYLTVDRLLTSPGERGARVLNSARNEIAPAPQKVSATVQKVASEQATPAALPPDASTPPDVTGAQARAAALPATIASASLRHAAANGDPAAEFEIGSRYSEGRGVSPDHTQAFAWYQRAAGRGYSPAQFRLGALYERGVGVEKDAERAKVWYRRAGEKGHAKAMHNLAVLLSSGENPDMPQAARWFREAAERNLADSQYNLAMLNEAGQGVAKNLAEAFKWYALAARSGDAEAAKRLDVVRRQLSKGELAAAEKAVKTWMPADMAATPGTASVPERAQP